MQFSLLRHSILYSFALFLILGTWAFPANDVAIQKDGHNTTVSIVPRGPGPLVSLLLRAQAEGNLLDPKGNNTEIEILARRFGDTDWNLGIFNSPKNFVCIVITAQGVILVEIPWEKFLHSHTKLSWGLRFQEDVYLPNIWDPLLRRNGKLRLKLAQWKRENPSITWFADPLQIVQSTRNSFRSPTRGSKNMPYYSDAIARLDADIRTFWSTVDGKSIPDILSHEGRSEQVLVARTIGTPLSPDSKPDSAIVVVWNTAKKRYSIWIGSKDATRSYKAETLSYHTDRGIIRVMPFL